MPNLSVGATLPAPEGQKPGIKLTSESVILWRRRNAFSSSAAVSPG
jgi:hypothetical protein